MNNHQGNPQVFMWRGKKLSLLSRDELVDALNEVCEENRKLNSDENIRRRSAMKAQAFVQEAKNENENETDKPISLTKVFCFGFVLVLGGGLGLHTVQNIISIMDGLKVLLPVWFN